MDELNEGVVIAGSAFTSAKHSAKIFDSKLSVGDVGWLVPVVGVVVVEEGVGVMVGGWFATRGAGRLVGVVVVGERGFAANDVVVGVVTSGGEDLIGSDLMLLRSWWMGMKSPSVLVYCWWFLRAGGVLWLWLGLVSLSLSLSLNTVSNANVVGIVVVKVVCGGGETVFVVVVVVVVIFVFVFVAVWIGVDGEVVVVGVGVAVVVALAWVAAVVVRAWLP